MGEGSGSLYGKGNGTRARGRGTSSEQIFSVRLGTYQFNNVSLLFLTFLWFQATLLQIFKKHLFPTSFTCVFSVPKLILITDWWSRWFYTIHIQCAENPEQQEVLEHVFCSVQSKHGRSSHIYNQKSKYVTRLLFPFSGGSQSRCTNLLFCNFFAENCMKMKEFGPPPPCIR